MPHMMSYMEGISGIAAAQIVVLSGCGNCKWRLSVCPSVRPSAYLSVRSAAAESCIPEFGEV